MTGLHPRIHETRGRGKGVGWASCRADTLYREYPNSIGIKAIVLGTLAVQDKALSESERWSSRRGI